MGQRYSVAVIQKVSVLCKAVPKDILTDAKGTDFCVHSP